MNSRLFLRGFSSVFVVIAVVVVLGVVAVVAVKGLGLGPKTTDAPAISTQDPIVKSLNTQSDSDDVSYIEADINATNLDGIDAGADQIEAELQTQ